MIAFARGADPVATSVVGSVDQGLPGHSWMRLADPATSIAQRANQI